MLLVDRSVDHEPLSVNLHYLPVYAEEAAGAQDVCSWPVCDDLPQCRVGFRGRSGLVSLTRSLAR
jgi:hypothetical protein